jgi:UDP-N-acetyl-D-mannosaminuronic acid dehydrogenase
LRATTSSEVIGEHDNVVVTIGTPVDEFMDPSVRSFDRAIDRVLDQMHDGQLLILRSTVFPGVTNRLGRRVSDRGLRIDIAHCPERIAQGFALEELTNLPQIVGGLTQGASQRAAALFSLLGPKIIMLPPTEAELTKLFSNAYRYISFAISNQFFVIAQKFGADFGRIRRAMTVDYPRMAGFPTAGLAGGPCLLKDTMQLAAFNHNAFVIGQAAMMVNEGLPSTIVEAVKARYDLAGMTAAILGMAFKGNSDDPRDSLAYKLRKVLTLECRSVLCTDPHVQDSSFVPLETALWTADIVFLGACHEEYRNLVIEKPVVDVFQFLNHAGATSALERSAA